MNLKPFYRTIRLTTREDRLLQYAAARQSAIDFRDMAATHARQGNDGQTAMRFAREYGAEARRLWKLLTKGAA